MLALLLSLWICFEFCHSTPCGGGLFCTCFEEINLITCAGKGLTHFPNMGIAERIMCRTLILDLNEITSLDGFVMSEWPQLEEIRLHKNPMDICSWTDALKQDVGNRLIISDDCGMNTKKVWKNRHTSDLPKIKTDSINTHIIATPRMVEEKTSTNDRDESDDRSDAGDGLPTTTTTRPPITMTMTTGYSGNTTLPQEWSIDVTASNKRLAIVISIPISILGMAFVFVVKIIWRRSSPRSVSVDVTTRPGGSGCFNCCKKNKNKRSPTPSSRGIMMDGYTYDNATSLKTTPSPSLFSINSNASDDLFEFRSDLSAHYNTDNREGIDLNICHII